MPNPLFERPRSAGVRGAPPPPDREALEEFVRQASESAECLPEPELVSEVFFARRTTVPTEVALCLTGSILSGDEARAIWGEQEIRVTWDGRDADVARAAIDGGADGLFIVLPTETPDATCARVAGLIVLTGRRVRLSMPQPPELGVAIAWLRAAERWLAATDERPPLTFVTGLVIEPSTPLAD